MAQMKIILNTTDGSAVSVDVRPEETYLMLKERVQVESGLNLDISQIFYNGKQVAAKQNVYESFFGDAQPSKVSDDDNISCVVEGCPTTKLTHPEKKIFKFPLEADKFSNWLLRCNRHDLLGRLPISLNEECGVCSDHFPAACFIDKTTRQKLRKGSIPVLEDSPVQSDNFSILGTEMIIPEEGSLGESDNTEGSVSYVLNEEDEVKCKTEQPDETEVEHLHANQDEVDEEDLQEDELEELEEEEEDDEESSDSELQVHPGLLCRLCAQVVEDAHFIFSDTGKKEKLLEKISTTLPITVHCNDILPKQVCTECLTSLNKCYDFTMACVRAEKSLKKITTKFRCKKDALPEPENLLNGGGETSNATGYEETIKHEADCFDCPLCCEGSMALHKDVNIDEIEGRDPDPDIVQEYLADSALWEENYEPYHHLDGKDEEVDGDIDDGEEEEDEDATCVICGENYISVDHLIEHAQSHSDGVSFPCGLCGLGFEREADLMLHIGMHRNSEIGSKYKCGDCGKLFPSEARAEFHQDYAHGMDESLSRACAECGKIFKREGNLWDHVRMLHRGEKPYSCPTCAKTFHIKARLKSHIRIHSGDAPFECDVCSETFPDGALLKAHEATHGEMKMYQCDQCGRCFTRKYMFNAHVRAHLEKKPRIYSCRICGEDGFETLPKLLAHRRSMHQDVMLPLGAKKDKTHRCDQCDKAFTGRVALKHHMMSHTGELPHVCEFCNKGFTQKRSLILHRRTHTGEKPYECGECGKRFVQSAHLYSHLRLHTGEKPYQCSECDATFRLKDVRDSHQRKHTGERPFKCKVCEKSFRTSHSYYQHTWIHTGRKPYPCTYCGKAFRRSNGLKVHIRIHTGEKPHECDVCGRGFAQKQDMKKHRNLHTTGKL